MGNSHATWDHTVLPATRQKCKSCLYPEPKQVLDLATPEGCKAELCYVKAGVEPVTCKSQVQLPIAKARRNIKCHRIFLKICILLETCNSS